MFHFDTTWSPPTPFTQANSRGAVLFASSPGNGGGLTRPHQTKKKEALCQSKDGIHGLRFMPEVTAYQNDSNSRKTVKCGKVAA